jgi:prevent-host-death family protein
MKSFSAAEANRKFSSVLRQVRQGKTIVVTSRGEAVAIIAPVRQGQLQRAKAQTRLLKRLRSQRATGSRDWTREELYSSPR